MRYSAKNLLVALVVLAIGVAIGAALLYLGHTDDAPPLGLTGILLMVGAAVISAKLTRRAP